ncbi:hypothetical protein J4441_03435 [Candidatus Micrarchaeota archaeon]|nr:hypothetical protein [Candidatus Micrarchaeota archaeon]
MEAELAYMAGLISGDGHLELGRNRVDIRIYPKRFRRTIFKLARKLVGRGGNIADKSLKVRITDRKFTKTMMDVFEIPKGSKSKIMKVPKTIMHAPRKIQNAYVAGWYDAEGWIEVDKRRKPSYARLRFCVTNREICEFILDVLQKNKLGRAMFSSGKRFCVDINGNERCEKFMREFPVKKIGMPSAH